MFCPGNKYGIWGTKLSLSNILRGLLIRGAPQCNYLYYHSLTEVIFGFERTSYSNLEGNDEEVCVVVQSPGALSKEVVVTVTSTDISAEGKRYYTWHACTVRIW